MVCNIKFVKKNNLRCHWVTLVNLLKYPLLWPRVSLIPVYRSLNVPVRKSCRVILRFWKITRGRNSQVSTMSRHKLRPCHIHIVLLSEERRIIHVHMNCLNLIYNKRVSKRTFYPSSFSFMFFLHTHSDIHQKKIFYMSQTSLPRV